MYTINQSMNIYFANVLIEIDIVVLMLILPHSEDSHRQGCFRDWYTLLVEILQYYSKAERKNKTSAKKQILNQCNKSKSVFQPDSRYYLAGWQQSWARFRCSLCSCSNMCRVRAWTCNHVHHPHCHINLAEHHKVQLLELNKNIGQC